jgi:hypothetical protein
MKIPDAVELTRVDVGPADAGNRVKLMFKGLIHAAGNLASFFSGSICVIPALQAAQDSVKKMQSYPSCVLELPTGILTLQRVRPRSGDRPFSATQDNSRMHS